jgi:integrase
VAIVLASTGLHISELERLYEGNGGLYEPAEWQKAKGVLVNIMVLHKGGSNHVVALTDPDAVAAVNRVLARKRFPARSTMALESVKASKKIGAKFSIGWLRHSTATWLALANVSVEDIAKQLGHTSTKMAKAVYIDLGTTAHPVPIPRLRLVSG